MRKVIKRNQDVVNFDPSKITKAIVNAMHEVDSVDSKKAEDITKRVVDKLFEAQDSSYVPSVDQIHDIVENVLMNTKLNHVAKSYILHRDKTRPNIFRKRRNLKPYEYPNLNEYVDAIRHSYWVHTEFNFTSDIQDMAPYCAYTL